MILIKNRNKELFALHDKIFSSAALDISISQSSRRIMGDIPPETLSGKPPIAPINWIYGQIPKNKALVCVATVSHHQAIEQDALLTKRSSQEFADDIDCYCVDEWGDEEFTNSCWHENDDLTQYYQTESFAFELS